MRKLSTFGKIVVLMFFLSLLTICLLVGIPLGRKYGPDAVTYVRERISSKPTATVVVTRAVRAPTSTPIPPATKAPIAVLTSTSIPARPSVTPLGVKPTETTKSVVIEPTPTKELPKLTVAIDAFASYYPLIIVKQLKLDNKYGFDLDLIPMCSTEENCFTEEERTQKMASGEWDATCTTLDKIALNPSIGVLTTIIDETDRADKIVVSPEIRTINDLRGKRISFAEGAVGEFFVHYLLNLVKIRPEEVVLTPAKDVVAATEMFVNGFVNAVSGWEPDVDEAINAGGSVLIDSGKLRIVVDILITSKQAVALKPDLVQSLHSAWFEALAFLLQEPGRAEKLIIEWGNNEWSYVANDGDLQSMLETIAQATLGQNEIAFSHKEMVAARIQEAKQIWQWSGKVVPEFDPRTLIEPRYVLASAKNPGLTTSAQPVNPTFLMTSKPDIKKLTDEEVGKATTVAVLPLEKIPFESDSARLTKNAMSDLSGKVVPVLRNSKLYLKIEGSAAQPGPKGRFTLQQTRDFAFQRALSVATYLAGQGIDPARLIMGTVDPKFPDSVKETELEQDRFVKFSLITVSGQ